MISLLGALGLQVSGWEALPEQQVWGAFDAVHDMLDELGD